MAELICTQDMKVSPEHLLIYFPSAHKPLTRSPGVIDTAEGVITAGKSMSVYVTEYPFS